MGSVTFRSTASFLLRMTLDPCLIRPENAKEIFVERTADAFVEDDDEPTINEMVTRTTNEF